MAIRMLGKTSLVAGFLASVLVASCGTAHYSKFYERFAGKCEKTPGDAKRSDTYIPNLSAIKREFIQTLDEHEAEVRQCYTDALRYGETHGAMLLAISLEPDGRADPVTVSADSTTFAPLSCCVVSVVTSIRFPSTGEHTNVGFDYPFEFHTVRMPNSENGAVTWFRSAATKAGYLAELDEASVVIGGQSFYPVASDTVHYVTDEKEDADAGTK